MGECAKNKRFMLSACSKACAVCDEKRNGCSRRNATAGYATHRPRTPDEQTPGRSAAHTCEPRLGQACRGRGRGVTGGDVPTSPHRLPPVVAHRALHRPTHRAGVPLRHRVGTACAPREHRGVHMRTRARAHAYAHAHVHMHIHLQFEDLLSEAEAEELINRCRNFGKFERSQVLQPLILPHPSYTPLASATPPYATRRRGIRSRRCAPRHSAGATTTTTALLTLRCAR